MLLALQSALLAAVSMMLGLMRWPTVHWRLAESYAIATPPQQQTIGALFDGFNAYLGIISVSSSAS